MMISLGVTVIRLRRLPRWSQLQPLLTEWRQRIRSRCELERLSERDLADMRMTKLDAFNETRKPFWEA